MDARAGQQADEKFQMRDRVWQGIWLRVWVQAQGLVWRRGRGPVAGHIAVLVGERIAEEAGHAGG